MALDPSTLLSRTTAGDAELSTPTNGLSLGQRKVLTYLEAPQALEELIAQRALDAAKLDRDLAKLAAIGLIAINGQRSPLASEAVVIGPQRSASMLRWLVPVLLLAGGAIAWFSFSGNASRKPATTAIGVAATAPRPASDATTDGTLAVGSNATGVADTRSAATDMPAARTALAALDGRRGGDPRAATGDPRATTVAPGTIARQPTAPAAAETPPSSATLRAGGGVSPVADSAAQASAAGRGAVATTPPANPTVATAQGTGPASARSAVEASAEGHAGQAGDARNDTGGKTEPRPAAGAPPGNAAQPTKAVPSAVASAPSNAAVAGSAATAPAAPAAGVIASAPPVTLAMAAPSSADAHPQPLQKLVPLTRENPEFPREALRNGVTSGTVKARLTIDALGKVTAVSIVDARPTRVFDRAVTLALSHWTFAAGDAPRSTEVEIAFKRD